MDISTLFLVSGATIALLFLGAIGFMWLILKAMEIPRE